MKVSNRNIARRVHGWLFREVFGPGVPSYIRFTPILAIIYSGDRFENKHKLWSCAGLIRHEAVSDGKICRNRKVKGCSELKAVFMGTATSGHDVRQRNYKCDYFDGIQ
jgi:hypothetical protein